jgi:hypothetical protein
MLKDRNDRQGCTVFKCRSTATLKDRLIATIAILSASLGAESLAATHPVAPNQLFSNPVLQVHAPASTGWSEITETADKIAFGKNGLIGGETFAAAVFLFHIPAFASSDAFTEYVREGVVKDSSADRFDAVELSVQYSSERSYPCVRYHGTSIDKKARIAPFFTKKLRIENIALYCQHPDKPGLGFAVSYSHRGGSDDTNIDEEAESFIDSVQVTPAINKP